MDKFLLRQKAATIHEKYEVWDEQGQPDLYTVAEFKKIVEKIP